MTGFYVLGPLLLRVGDRSVQVSAARLQQMLLVLLSARGEPVPLDVLVDALWEGRPPRSARKTTHVYVHRLRRLLGDDSRLSYQGTGYVLEVRPGELDADRCEALVAEAKDATGRGDLEAAWRLLGQARELWRGEPYAELRGVAVVDAARRRAGDLRLTAIEARAAAGLKIGRLDEVVRELTEAVGEHPFHEGLRAQLMLALYRGGRRVEALELYRDTHRMLVEELGVEPAPELRQLHERILRDDPALVRPRRPAGSPPRHLPHDIPDFVGRRADLEWLDVRAAGDAAQTVIISAIAGVAGVGKTALAVRWAHRAAERYPDGQLYINLRGYDTGRPLGRLAALAQLLLSLGVPAEKLPADEDAAASMYRSALAGRRMLVLLDNARSAEQVRPLLPGDAGCLVVVTSRDRLTGLIATEGAHRLTLGLLDGDDALSLVRRIVGDARVGGDPAAAARLVELCGRLPLALRIAAAHLVDRPGQAIADYVAELAGTDLIAALSIEDDERFAVAAVLDHSYRALPEDARRAFRLLAVIPGPDFTCDQAAALLDVSTAQAASTLDTLASGHVIEHHGAGRYAFHDLIRDFARAVLRSAGDRIDEARQRLYAHLDKTAAAANAAIASPGAAFASPATAAASTVAHGAAASPNLALASPATANVAGAIAEPSDGNGRSAQEALTWIAAERANLIAVVSDAATNKLPEVACGIAKSLWHAFHYAGHTSDWVSTFETAVAAVGETEDDESHVFLLHALAQGYSRAGQYDRAVETNLRCLEIRLSKGDDLGAARSRASLAITYERQGRYQEALELLIPSLAAFQEHGERLVEAAMRVTLLASLYSRLGRYEEARDTVHAALPVLEQLGTPFDRIRALTSLAEAYRHLDLLDVALEHIDEARRLAVKLGDRSSEAQTSNRMADVLLDLGDLGRSISMRLKAIELFQQLGIVGGECEARVDLGRTHAAAGAPDLALEAYSDALRLATALGSRHQRARALAGIGTLSRDPVSLREALAILEPISAAEAAEVSSALRDIHT